MASLETWRREADRYQSIADAWRIEERRSLRGTLQALVLLATIAGFALWAVGVIR